MIFTPLGLLASGTAYGEWSGEELSSKLGFVPEGMTKFSDKWNAIFHDYSISAIGNGLFNSAIGYILCAVIALMVILIITMIIGTLQKNKGKNIDSRTI